MAIATPISQSWFIMAPKNKKIATFWEWRIAIYYHYAVPPKSLPKAGKSSYCTQTNERVDRRSVICEVPRFRCDAFLQFQEMCLFICF